MRFLCPAVEQPRCVNAVIGAVNGRRRLVIRMLWLASAPSEAIEAARDTAMNPAVCGACALAVVADGQGPAYPGIPDHEPDVAKGRIGAGTVHRAMNEHRGVASGGGAYVSESNFFESDFQHAYWGANYSRRAEVKKKYDPDGLFFVHNGVGSSKWTRDGFTRL